jgi:hypothetical protein
VARQTLQALDDGIPGQFVECGVWRGGVAFLIAQLLKWNAATRRVFLCDSFEGLPPPEAIDGSAAAAWARDTTAPAYFDNCRAGLAEVQQTARTLGVHDATTFVPGWFTNTLPVLKTTLGSLAYLRIDADWHASVLTCLEALYDLVSPGGYVVLDDYDYWDGCAIAVHEFLGSRKLAHRLQHDGCAYFRKL